VSVGEERRSERRGEERAEEERRGERGGEERKHTNSLRNKIGKNVRIHGTGSIPVDVADGYWIFNIVIWQYYSDLII
jgi:hypothetical protein